MAELLVGDDGIAVTPAETAHVTARCGGADAPVVAHGQITKSVVAF